MIHSILNLFFVGNYMLVCTNYMIPTRYVAVDVPFVSYDSKLFISQQLCMRKDIIICDFSDETSLRVYEPLAPLIPTPANVQHIQTLFYYSVQSNDWV